MKKAKDPDNQKWFAEKFAEMAEIKKQLAAFDAKRASKTSEATAAEILPYEPPRFKDPIKKSSRPIAKNPACFFPKTVPEKKPSMAFPEVPLSKRKKQKLDKPIETLTEKRRRTALELHRSIASPEKRQRAEQWQYELDHAPLATFPPLK